MLRSDTPTINVRARNGRDPCNTPTSLDPLDPDASDLDVGNVADPILDDVTTGETLGNYRLLGLLGEGGMGSVYLAEHVEYGGRVALKVLHRHLTQDRDLVNRFVDEVRAVSRIQHPNVVRITDFVSGKRVYYAMEVLRGSTLARELRTYGAVPLRRALDIACHVCDALDAVHGEGIVHRDLKPENIFLTVDEDGSEVVKILDFGVAKFEDHMAKLTPPNSLVGTPVYMAPEQAVAGEIDHRADIYALGVMLYEMLCGKPPYGGNTAAVIRAHLEETPTPLRFHRELGLTIPPKLDKLVMKCLSKSRNRRPASMAVVREQLIAIAATLSDSSDGDQGGSNQKKRRSRQSGFWHAVAEIGRRPRTEALTKTATRNEQRKSSKPYIGFHPGRRRWLRVLCAAAGGLTLVAFGYLAGFIDGAANNVQSATRCIPTTAPAAAEFGNRAEAAPSLQCCATAGCTGDQPTQISSPR